MRIIKRYIFNELISSLFVCLAIFTFILLMDRIFELIDLIINKGVHIVIVLKLLLYILPFIFSLSIPMSLLMATLLTFGRLSSDNEIIAMKAGGIHPYRIMGPLILFGLLLSLVMFFFNDKVVPQANNNFKNMYYEIANKRPVIKLEEHTFTDIKNYTLYVDNINHKTSLMKGVVIYKRESGKLPMMITAKEGIWIVNNEQEIILRLSQGSIHKTDELDPGKHSKLSFNNYVINIDISDPNTQNSMRKKSIREMNRNELKKEISTLSNNNIKHNSLLVELNMRSVIPFACLVFVLIGLPLGITMSRSGKSVGFGVSLALIFLYYSLLVLGITFGEKGHLPPAVSVWIPNIVIGVIGIFLIGKSLKQ